MHAIDPRRLKPGAIIKFRSLLSGYFLWAGVVSVSHDDPIPDHCRMNLTDGREIQIPYHFLYAQY